MSILSSRLEDYLSMRRGLGFKLKSDGTALLSFVAFMELNNATRITNELAFSWATLPKNVKANHWSCRLRFVRGFASYCHAFDQCSVVPPSQLLPASQQRSSPYFFSDVDIKQLLQLCLVQDDSAGVSGKTTHCILSLLCTTGLRISEALRLDVDDFDAEKGILYVRVSKFGKSRLIPLHPSVVALLMDYLSSAKSLTTVLEPVALFRNATAQRPSYDNIYRRFRRLSNVFPDQLGRRRPRLHDLRHRFAVKTLLNWYHDGIDVQRWLPVLSTYLGHVEVRDTYWYISACPELMDAARQRLESRWESRS
jgi:integrase/recombinase XerD